MSLNTRKLCVRASFSRFVVPRVATRELVCDLIASAVAFERDTILFQNSQNVRIVHIHFMCMWVCAKYSTIHTHTHIFNFRSCHFVVEALCSRTSSNYFAMCFVTILWKKLRCIIQLFEWATMSIIANKIGGKNDFIYWLFAKFCETISITYDVHLRRLCDSEWRNRMQYRRAFA